MEGNELLNGCSNCKQTIGHDGGYVCDLCMLKIHKTCASLQPSEIKCMPLQKRSLLIVCNTCREYLSRTRFMVQMFEEMKNEIVQLKEEVCKLRETNSLKTCGGEGIYTYSGALTSGKKDSGFPQLPTLIIKPKRAQSESMTRKEVQSKINPSKLKVGINNLRATKRGELIVKCRTQEELEVLKNVTEKSLAGDYTVDIPKLKSPKIKVVGYKGGGDKTEIEDNIRNQNEWIRPGDDFEITYIKEIRSKNCSTIFITCSPGMYTMALRAGRLCIGWERCQVYEDLGLLRCFKCQGYYHKSSVCNGSIACGKCAGDHDTSSCKSLSRKCVNCSAANGNYGTNYSTDHAASDAKCPSSVYHMKILRSKINYAT